MGDIDPERKEQRPRERGTGTQKEGKRDPERGGQEAQGQERGTEIDA